MALTDVQKKLLDLLFELDELLRKHNITYMLYCGSQLGADRHGTIIPWDDDLDIMMSLENYDRFLEVAKSELPKNRLVNALEYSTEYPLCYGRYVDATTTALQRHTVFGGIDPGIKIDIFFCVPTHSNEKKALSHQMQILAFNEVLNDSVIMEYRRPEEFFPYYEKEKKLFQKLGRTAYIKKRLPQLKYKYAKKSRDQYIFFSGMLGNSHFFSSTEITNVKDMDINGHSVMVAANGPYYNIESYGESWYQIPANVSKPHHVWILDMNTPYSKYLDTIGEHLNLKQIHDAMRTRKAMRLTEQIQYKDAFIEIANLKNLAIGMSVETEYMNSDHSKLSLSDQYQLFSPFYARQLARENRWYHLPVPLQPDTMSAALHCLASMGEFAKVLDILAITGKDIPGIHEILQAAHRSRELIYAIFVHPSDLASIENDELLQSEMPNLSIDEAKGRKLLTQMRECNSNAERRSFAESLMAFVKHSAETFGRRSELTILEAFALQELERQNISGALPSSESVFRECALTVNNGFVAQEIYDQGIDMLAEREANVEDELTQAKDTVIHHYITEDEYIKIKESLQKEASGNDALDLALKTRNGSEYMVLYNRTYLCATIKGIVDQKLDLMCGREFWHICSPEEIRTEETTASVFANNITPSEYLKEAEKAGLLSSYNVGIYKKYRKWKKDAGSEADRIVKQYNKDFLSYTEHYGL